MCLPAIAAAAIEVGKIALTAWAGNELGKSMAGKAPQTPKITDQGPAPVMVDPNPQQTEAERVKKLKDMRQGMTSTIKTSPQGVTNSATTLKPLPMAVNPMAFSPLAKNKLGA
jgi:hypothetical protein